MEFVGDLHAEERARIDEEIIELTNRLHFLKSRRNDIAPISRLPPELLIRIFFSSRSRREYESAYYQWTVVTHVSSQWRKLALETPTLWSKIVQTHTHEPSPWAVVSYARAGSTPLEVHVLNIDLNDSISQFLFTLLSEMHRIQTLEVGIQPGKTDRTRLDKLIAYLETPAPILQEVRLKTSYRNSLLTPNPPFGANAPALRKLGLDRVKLDWRAFPLQRLTSLQLGSFDSDCDLPFNEFLDVLCMTPQLQELQVSPAICVRDGDTSYTRREKIILRSITTLITSFYWDTLTAFFTIISIPPRTEIYVMVWGTGYDWKDFYQPLSRCFIAGPVALCRMELSLKSLGSRSAIKFWEDLDAEQGPLIRVDFSQLDTGALTEAVQYLPVAELHTLNIGHFLPHDSVWDFSDFPFPPALKSLMLCGLFIGRFLNFIEANPSSLKALEVLELQYYWISDVESQLEVLRRVFEIWRSEIGGKLKSLKLRGVSTSSAISELLAPLDEFVEMKVVL